MRRLISAAALAALAPLGASETAEAQTAADQARWEDALQRYREETRRYYQEWDRYQAARRGDAQDERAPEGREPEPAPAPTAPPTDQAPVPAEQRYAPPPSSYEEVPPSGDAPTPPAETAPTAPPAAASPLPAPMDQPSLAPMPAPAQAAPVAPSMPPPDPGEATPDLAPIDHDDRFGGGYDAAKFYRDAAEYRERVLQPQERIYRGSDNRFYCQRSDGTTGLIVGAFGGNRLAGVIDAGRSRTAGAVLAAIANGLAGDENEGKDQAIRCR